jgi:hypothetical protein
VGQHVRVQVDGRLGQELDLLALDEVHQVDAVLRGFSQELIAGFVKAQEDAPLPTRCARREELQAQECFSGAGAPGEHRHRLPGEPSPEHSVQLRQVERGAGGRIEGDRRARREHLELRVAGEAARVDAERVQTWQRGRAAALDHLQVAPMAYALSLEKQAEHRVRHREVQR